jgi:hypothetical protein
MTVDPKALIAEIKDVLEKSNISTLTLEFELDKRFDQLEAWVDEQLVDYNDIVIPMEPKNRYKIRIIRVEP